jgi:hypothetical protein
MELEGMSWEEAASILAAHDPVYTASLQRYI